MFFYVYGIFIVFRLPPYVHIPLKDLVINFIIRSCVSVDYDRSTHVHCLPNMLVEQ